MAKIAIFFLLDKSALPENFGIKLSVEGSAPLYDSIVRDSSLTKLVYADSVAYCLRLFKKPYTTDFLILVKDLDYHAGGNLIESCRQQALSILEHKGEKPFYDPDYLLRAMWLPKGVQKQEFNTMINSFSGDTNVDPDELLKLDSRAGWIMNHPDGFIFGTKNETDFLRGLVFYSLGIAYHRQMSDAVNQLSLAAGTRGEQIPHLLQQIHRFLGQYYYLNPVRPAARQDVKEFSHIVEPLELNTLKAELDQKIFRVSAIGSGNSATGSATEAVSFSASKSEFRADDLSYQANEPQSSSAKLMLGLALVLAAGGLGWLVNDGGQPAWLSSLLAFVGIQ